LLHRTRLQRAELDSCVVDIVVERLAVHIVVDYFAVGNCGQTGCLFDSAPSARNPMVEADYDLNLRTMDVWTGLELRLQVGEFHPYL
jgi:hypothetical protein